MEVVAAIAVQEGKVLIARKKPGKALAGLWEFPGGKVEPGETYQASLAREIREEMGVEIKAADVFESTTYSYPTKTITLIGIKSQFLSNNFTLVDHDEVAWVPIDLLLEYELAPADIPIAHSILTRRDEF